MGGLCQGTGGLHQGTGGLHPGRGGLGQGRGGHRQGRGGLAVGHRGGHDFASSLSLRFQHQHCTEIPQLFDDFYQMVEKQNKRQRFSELSQPMSLPRRGPLSSPCR